MELNNIFDDGSGNKIKRNAYNVYFLIKNGEPYYVGVSLHGKSRYSGERKKDMVFFAAFNNRYDACECETYWISEFTKRGFYLKNKHEKTHPVRYVNTLSRMVRIYLSKASLDFIIAYEKKGVFRDDLINDIIVKVGKQIFKPKPLDVDKLKKNWMNDKFASVLERLKHKTEAVFRDWDVIDNYKKGFKKKEARVRLVGEAKEFIEAMEAHGLYASVLINFIIEQAIPTKDMIDVNNK